MEIRAILKILRPLKNRIHFNTGLHCIFICLCTGGAAALILAWASLWVTIPHLLRSILALYGVFAAGGLIVSLFSAPGTKRLLETADELGLKERLTTAWQLREEDTVIARLQREDTYKTVSNTDFKRLYPLRFPVRPAMVVAITILLTSVSFAIPSQAREDSRQLEKLQSEVERQIEELEKVEKDLRERGEIGDAEQEKIAAELARLAQELKKAKTEEEALKTLSRTENELEKMDVHQQLNRLGEELSRNDLTNGLGEAVRDGSLTDMKQALEQLMQQLEEKTISPDELAEMLKQASEQIENPELQEKLQQAAQQVASNQTADQTEALDNLGDALSAMMQSKENGTSQALGQLSDAIQSAKNKLSRVDNSLSATANSSGKSGESSGQGQPKQGAGQAAQGNGSTAQNGQSAGAGSSQGKGTESSGAGNSSGLSQNGGGGGAGEGSTNKDAGYTGAETPGGGRQGGKGAEEEYERLYDPDYLGGDADPSVVSGQQQEGGLSTSSQTDRIPVEKGTIRPYQEVLSRYSGQAASYMEETEIPAGMKDIVRKYFESLE